MANKKTVKKNSNAQKHQATKSTSNKRDDASTKVYKNPAYSPVGKIIIAILAIAMMFGGLASLIYLIVTNA